MNSDSLVGLSASELAQRIASGEVRASEAVDAYIARIEKVNPALNAVVVTRFDAARAEARDMDARRARGEPLPPLAGVPVTIKECLDLAGTPSTFGLSTRAGHCAQTDELHVARLRAAGAIVLGKTNVSQCLIYTEADNPLYGRTNNPWQLARTPGGSSGGEGAIIAAGGSALGLGTDIGGSVRVPAAFCGIASLKPTSGRFPDPGRYSVPVGQQAIPSQIGVLARTVADVALGSEIINGGAQPAAGFAFADWRSVDVCKLRVAVYTDDGSFEIAPAMRRAVQEAAASLRAAGALVAEWTPPAIPDALVLFGRILTADGLHGMRRMLAGNPKTPQILQMLMGARLPLWLLSALRSLLRAAGQHSMANNMQSFGPARTHDYWLLVEQQLDYQQRFARALAHDRGGPFDLILSPASALPAFTHGATRDLLTAGAYAPLYNLLGYPAGVVPVTRVRDGEETSRIPGKDLIQKLAQRIERGSAGMPVAVQVIAKPWQEHEALAAMHVIEKAMQTQPDFPRTPVDPVTVT